MSALAASLFGVLVGVVSSVPPAGAGALLQVRRGLQGRFRSGMAVAIGGGLADAGYCLLAVLGLDYLLTRFPGVVMGVRWVGLFVLTGLGLHFLLSRQQLAGEGQGRSGGASLGRNFLLGLTLTGSDPTNLVTWTTGVAILTSFDFIAFEGAARFTFPFGVALGDIAWSAVLLALLRRHGPGVSRRLVSGVMRSLGLLFLVFAAVQAYRIAVSPETTAAVGPGSALFR